MEITTIIEQLRNLDLSTYDPKDETLRSEIVGLLNQVEGIPHVEITFHKGKSFIRARANKSKEEHLGKKSDYSYRPQEFNTTYQRASTPNQTMFYATVKLDDDDNNDDDDNKSYDPIVTGVVETVPMLGDTTRSGCQKVSFGKWSVREDINLIAIIQKDKYTEASSYIKELADGYKQFIETTTSKEIAKRSFAFTTFLADEFSKEVSCDYDYMISALFSELMTKNNPTIDGILYPSVKAGGKGINIAITPDATKKLDICMAGECYIYKHKDLTCIDFDTIAIIDGNEEVLKFVEQERHVEQILADLGVISIDELIKPE